MLVIQIDEDIAVRSVSGKQDEDDEIRYKQCEIEAVCVIDAAKRGIQKMLPDIGSNAPGRHRDCS